MNKIQMISLLENLDLPEDDYYILSGGCLLLYGIREEAQDLDLCVSSKLFNQLKKEYNIDEKSKNPVGFYKLMDDVEIVVQPKKNFQREYKDGYPVEKLETILAFKTKRKSSKDMVDIDNIRNFLLKKQIQ